MPTDALNSGTHELIITASNGCTSKLLVYPDILENSPAANLDNEITLNSDDYHENKISWETRY